MKTLVLYAHPRPDRSEINAIMYAAIGEVPGVSSVDLYAEYPDMVIDIDREQERLLEHDMIVLQHPLYWYSSPAILKEWQDLVLEHGFAYGHSATALRGKTVLNAVTCGAPAGAYTPEGANGADLRSLLAPFEKTFSLCGMTYLAPLALFEAGRAQADGRGAAHVATWKALLAGLTHDTLDLQAAREARLINSVLPTTTGSGGAR